MTLVPLRGRDPLPDDSHEKTRVQIVQPTIPTYRVPLFEALARDPDLDVTVYASPIDHFGIKAVTTDRMRVSLDHEFVCLFGKRLFWQSGLSLAPEMGPGSVLVVNGNPRFLSNVPLIMAARRRGIGVVWWGHGWTPGATEATASIRRWIMRAMDVILLYSDKEVADFVSRGFPESRVVSANNAISQEPIRTATRSWTTNRLQAFKAESGLTDRRVLLFSSRLSAKTRLHQLIDALAVLSNVDPSYLLIVVGDGDARVELERHVAGRGLKQNVRFLGALYDEARIAPWFLSADAYVYPGAIGLSLLHAFGYGLPAIVHDNARNQGPEYAAFRDGINGLAFQENDVQDLADTIQRVTANPGMRRTLADGARRTVDRDYSLHEMVRRFKMAVSRASHVARDRR